MIELKGASKLYEKVKVLTDISFRIDPGEFVCIIGPSGAGKSTLLHVLTGAETITKGKIEVDGVDLRLVPPLALQMYRRKLGIVFQDYKLLGNRTVAENIAFPLEVCGVPDEQIEKRVRKVLELVDLTKHAHTLPHALSGGEKARAAIGRAIVHDPIIILADEPTGNIDPDQSVKIMKLFKQIHDSGTTIVIATHDSGLVDALKPRVIQLVDGEIVRDSTGKYQNTIKKPTATTSTKSTSKIPKRKVKVTGIGA
jgi:cell division transport system ATP-binding protein